MRSTPVGRSLIAFAIVCAGISRSGHVRGSQSETPAPAEVQAFVRAALTDRIAAEDLPDLKVLDTSRPIGLRNVMPEAKQTLQEAAVPAVDGYRFFLLSPTDAQAGADKDAKPTAFVTVDRPVVNGDSATIDIGVDMAVPRQSNLVKLCCCTGRAEFRRAANGWTFVKWIGEICS